MKLYPLLHKLWISLPPQTWTETFAAIISLLLIFQAVVFFLDLLKGTLP